MQTLRWAYERAFFEYFLWSLRLNGTRDSNVYNALLIMVCLTTMNIVSVMLGVSIVSSEWVIPNSRLGAVALLAITFLLHYFLLIRNRAFERRQREYETESMSQRRARRLTTIIYALASIASVLGLALLKGNLNSAL